MTDIVIYIYIYILWVVIDHVGSQLISGVAPSTLGYYIAGGISLSSNLPWLALTMLS